MLKDFQVELELSPKNNRVIQTDATYWSHDVNTAKINIKLLRHSEPVVLNKDVTVRVMMLFDDENKSEHIYTAKIEDGKAGIVSIILDKNVRSYVGQVICGVYADYGAEQKTDNGYFTFAMKRSLIDKRMPEMKQYYVSDFEDTLAKMKLTNAEFAEVETKLNGRIDKIEKDIASNEVVKETDFNQLKTKVKKNNNHISSNIKMTMHFNFTDEKEVQENLDILKSLGYNTLHIQRNNNALTDVTGVATNKLLKQFRENGFGAILHVDYETLISDDYSDVKRWINAIDHNTNVVGYWYADEPFYRELPAAETELAYTRLKQITDKPIYVIDPGIKLSTYTKCFDVFVWNIYPNTPKYKGLTPQQLKYAWLHDYVNLFRSERYAAKNVMVMFPTIKHLEINGDAPTVQEIDTLIEFYKHVGVLSENISTFMYHFYDDGKFEDLKSSEYLRYLSNKIMQEGTVSNPQKIHIIPAKQLHSSESFVSTNLDYSPTYDSMVLKNGGKYAEIILKISKSGFYNNNELYDYALFHNNGDNKKKKLEIAISYDSINYIPIHVYGFGTISIDNYPKNISEKPFIKINNIADSVFVRFRIFNEDGTSMTSSVGEGVGFKHIRLAFL